MGLFGRSDHQIDPRNHGVLWHAWKCPHCDELHTKRVAPITKDMRGVYATALMAAVDEDIYHHTEQFFFGIIVDPNKMMTYAFRTAYDEGRHGYYVKAGPIDIKHLPRITRELPHNETSALEKFTQDLPEVPNSFVAADRSEFTRIVGPMETTYAAWAAVQDEPMPGLRKGHMFSEQVAKAFNYTLPDEEPQPVAATASENGAVKPMDKDQFAKLFGEGW